MTDRPLLEIDNLSVSYFSHNCEIPVVTGFSLSVGVGECMGLVGESGCGKSTVAWAIMRHLPSGGRITGGQIRFDGVDIGSLGRARLRRLRGAQIAMIYQEPMASLNPTMTAGRQLTEVPLTHERLTAREAKIRALEMLSDVKLSDPERVFDSYPHQISGGQQQRVVIAMALLARPRLLLLDEPTTALDVTVEAGITALVRELGEKFGMSMLFISHNLGLIAEMCDQITVMYSGHAVERGTCAQIFEETRHPYTQGLLRSIPMPHADKNARPLVALPGQLPLPGERPKGCNFAPRCAFVRKGLCDASEPLFEPVNRASAHMTRCMRHRDIDWSADQPPDGDAHGAKPPGEVVLAVSKLKKHFRVAANDLFGQGDKARVKANEAVSFEARRAETVAIVGESGCGKSTLARILLGLETATSGRVTLNSTDIGNLGIRERDTQLVRDIQMVFQNPFETLNPSHTVGAQLIRALEKFDVGDDHADRLERMAALLEQVKLTADFADRMPHELSGGQKQRIGLARALAGDPQMIVADEPVSALDVSVQAAVTGLLVDIQRELRTTLIFISHDLAIVRYIADKVVVMYLGHIVEQGPTQKVFAPPYHPYTESLIAAAPVADLSVRKRQIILEGELPSALSPPGGCPFQTRCAYKHLVPGNLCETQLPKSRQLPGQHSIKCHLAEDMLAKMDPVLADAS